MRKWIRDRIAALTKRAPRPEKFETLDAFINAVRVHGCTSVQIDHDEISGSRGESATVGRISEFRYVLQYSAMTPDGRQLACEHTCFKRLGSDYGRTESLAGSKAAIRNHLCGERAAASLREQLPEVSVHQIGPDGQPMNGRMYALLHRHAGIVGLAV